MYIYIYVHINKYHVYHTHIYIYIQCVYAHTDMSACTDICYIGYWESIWINRFCHMECQSSGQLSGWNILEPLRAKSKLCCVHCKEHLSKWVSKVTFDGFWFHVYKFWEGVPLTSFYHYWSCAQDGSRRLAWTGVWSTPKAANKEWEMLLMEDLFTCVPANNQKHPETQPVSIALSKSSAKLRARLLLPSGNLT